MLPPGTVLETRVAAAFRRSRLGQISPATIATLRVGESWLDVPAGTLLPLPCDEPHLGLVVEGLMRVSIAGPDGRLLTLRYIRPGDLIGVPSIVGQATTIADFRAVVDTSIVVLDVQRATTLAHRDATLALAFAEELGIMVRASVAALAATAFGSVRERLARHLLDLATTEDGHGRGLARVSQQELADAVGSVRDVIARNLGQLRDEGLIATRPTRIAILDPIGLREVAVRPGDEARSPAIGLGVSEAAAS